MPQRPTFQAVYHFLKDNFNVRPSEEFRSISFDRYVLLISSARSWFGDAVGDFLQDCFMPHGPPVEPGYEDSCSLYAFDFSTDEDFKADFEEFLALTTFPDEIASEG